MLYSSEQQQPQPVPIASMGAESATMRKRSVENAAARTTCIEYACDNHDSGIPRFAPTYVEAVVNGTLPSMQKEDTPDGGAFPTTARDRSDDDENTATNDDGGEHGRGDDGLALEGRLIPLMMARNGAECRGIASSADSGIHLPHKAEAQDMKRDAPQIACIDDVHHDDDLIDAAASALVAARVERELAPDSPDASTSDGSHFLAAASKFTSEGGGLVLDAATSAPLSPQDAHEPVIFAADAARSIDITDTVTSPWKFPEKADALLQALGLEFKMPTYATWPAFLTALIAKKVHLGKNKAVKHCGALCSAVVGSCRTIMRTLSSSSTN